MSGVYPNTFYRVSIKGLVFDDEGRVLVVKDGRDAWELPGGGLDHGESAKESLAREFNEELGLTGVRVGGPIAVKTVFLAERDAWLMWIVYSVQLSNTNFVLGEGTTQVQFADPKTLDRANQFENLVVEVVNKAGGAKLGQ